VHTSALHTRAAHASGFEVHDTVAPLQWARLWRVVDLFEHWLKQSVCTRLGGQIGFGEVRFDSEIGLVEVKLDWEIEACVRLLRSVAAAVHVFLIGFGRRTTVQSRTRIRLVRLVAQCAAEWAVR
jgi:hypothetical protein